MKAKITKHRGYWIAPEGHTSVHYKEGEIVTGWVAEMAIADGAAEKVGKFSAEGKDEPVLENKAAPAKKAPAKKKAAKKKG